MTSPRWVRVRAEPGGARVVARDWPGAAWVAVPLLAAGLALVGWGAVTRHAVEAGGGAVFVGVGAFAAWLAAAGRRDLVVARQGASLRVRGTEGAAPVRRPVDVTLPPGASVAVVPFPVPEGARDLPDRGGDLVLEAPGVRVRLARCAGPGWAAVLEGAAAALRGALANDDAAGPVS